MFFLCRVLQHAMPLTHAFPCTLNPSTPESLRPMFRRLPSSATHSLSPTIRTVHAENRAHSEQPTNPAIASPYSNHEGPLFTLIHPPANTRQCPIKGSNRTPARGPRPQLAKGVPMRVICLHFDFLAFWRFGVSSRHTGFAARLRSIDAVTYLKRKRARSDATPIPAYTYHR